MSFGGNAKIIYRNVGSFANAWGFGFDAGFMARTSTWRFGVVAKDITTTFNAWSFNFTDAEKQELYLTDNDIPVRSTELTAPSLLIGGGYNFAFGEKFHLMAEADFNMTFDGQGIADGDTLNQKKVWIFQPSLGAGFKIGNVSIDYAFTNLANQSNPLYTNVVSLKIDFTPKKERVLNHKGYAPKLPGNSQPKQQKVYYPQFQ